MDDVSKEFEGVFSSQPYKTSIDTDVNNRKGNKNVLLKDTMSNDLNMRFDLKNLSLSSENESVSNVLQLMQTMSQLPQQKSPHSEAFNKIF